MALSLCCCSLLLWYGSVHTTLFTLSFLFFFFFPSQECAKCLLRAVHSVPLLMWRVSREVYASCLYLSVWFWLTSSTWRPMPKELGVSLHKLCMNPFVNQYTSIECMFPGWLKKAFWKVVLHLGGSRISWNFSWRLYPAIVQIQRYKDPLPYLG